MDVKLTATIDISERVERIANRLLDALARGGDATGPTPTRERPAEAPGRPVEAVSGENKAIPQPTERKAVKSDLDRVREMPGGAELVEKLDLEVAPVTDEELRAALDACRKRLLGAEPKRNPRYSALTGFIRNLVADTYGAAVPSGIPNDLRPNFVRDLESVKIGEDGSFVLPREEGAPF